MKSHIFIKRLNKSGNYKSELDWDEAFKNKYNSKGNFKIFVQPIENCNGEYEIRYMKIKGGYIVSGEGYIITDRNEKDIDKEFYERFNDKWEPLVQTEVGSENELW